MTLAWEALPEQTTTDGQTSVSWSLAQPVADASQGIVMVTRNGLEAAPSEVSVSDDGAVVTYTPTYPFVDGENVWGRYVTPSVTALPAQTMHAGDTAAVWTLTRKVASLDDPTIAIFLNGQQQTGGKATPGADGLTIAYVPDAAFDDGDTVWGWYASVEDAGAADTTASGIIQAAMEVARRRLGLDDEEWPDAWLYAECSAVLALYRQQYDGLSDLSALGGDDTALLGLIVGLTTVARLMTGLHFARSGGATSIRGKETAVSYAAGGAQGADVFRTEAAGYLSLLTPIRAMRADFAAAHSPFLVGGRTRRQGFGSILLWRQIFDEMFTFTFPPGWPVGGWPL